MSRQLNGSVELTALVHVRMEVKGQNGKVMGTFIPDIVNTADVVEKKDQNPGVYIPVIVWINDEENERGQIGSIKQSLPSKIYKEMDKEKAKEVSKELPYLGNLKDFSGGGGQASGAAASGTYTPDSDDLPF